MGKAMEAMQHEPAPAPLLCGFGSFTPAWLQRLHTARYLLISMSICGIIQGMIVNGFISTSISSLEKRFSLSSTQSGIFGAFYDVAVVLVLVPVCHFGTNGHKGKFIGIGMFLVGVGSLILISPHFFGRYSAGSLVSELCDSTNSLFCAGPDAGNTASNTLSYYVLLISQIFIGVGAAPLFTLGIAYIDENVSQTASPVYLGLYLAASTVGPAAGFIIGGLSLNIWGDIGKTDYHDLNISGPSDPRWYGAWWFGFFFAGIAALIACIPLMAFAEQLPEAKGHREKDVDQTHSDLKTEMGTGLTDLPKSFKLLMSNPTFAGLTLMQTAESFLMNGFITFIPKLFENLFTLSSSNASFYTGAIVVPMGLLGNVAGGLLIRYFKMRCNQMMLLALLFNSIAGALCFVMLMQCPDVGFAGVTTGYDRNSQPGGISTTCNSACHCSDHYEPVCNEALQLTYYSPCHAGCRSKSSANMTWFDCSCINPSGPFIAFPSPKASPSVTQGLCQTNCGGFKLFMCIFGLLVFFTFCSAMPIQQSTLRVVSFQHRTIALGFGWLFMRAFGSIPGAIFFGVAIDSTCILWREQCGIAQSCLRYSNFYLSRAMFIFAIALKTIIVSCLFAAWYFYKPPTVATIEPESVGKHTVAPITAVENFTLKSRDGSANGLGDNI